MSALLERLLRESQERFPHSPSKQYLDSRHISLEAQTEFQFGSFPSGKEIKHTSLPVEELLEAGLLYQREASGHQGSFLYRSSFLEHHPLVLPYHDTYGKVIALVGRSLLTDSERQEQKISKYKNTVFNKSEHLFNLHRAKKAIVEQNCAYLVEGQLDVIRAWEKGFFNFVAVGSSDLSFSQLLLLLRYTENIFLLFDNDEAGIKGRRKIMQKWKDKANFQCAFLPKYYKDADEYFSDESYSGGLALRMEELE